MKIFKRILQALLILIILIFIAGLLLVRHVSKRSIPDYTKDLTLNGLTANVEVFRDHYGIPHVYAETEADLYTAVGYLLAQDRLWQMDLLRRVTLGRLSEIFGESFVDTDLLLRSLRYSKKSEELLKTTDKEIVSALEAFSNGVNQYIESHQKKLPPEFAILRYKPEKWEPVHSLNLIGYMAWDLKAGWSEFILEDIRKVVDSAHFAELIPDPGIYKTYVYPDYNREPARSTGEDFMDATGKLNDLGIEIFNASNNWAVAGKRSATGKPILANDMHLTLNIPGIWYQMHQVVKGKLNVTGLVLPGQPLIICGHNDSIAWGMTNAYVDNVDFYLEKINPDDSGEYLYNGEWKPFIAQKEIIRTSDGISFEKEIRYSHRGPVISPFKNIKNEVVTMHWVGDENSDEMKAVYLLNRASDWEEFKEAVSNFRSISQNIVYADVRGNIGLYYCAGIPIRRRDILTGVLPGWTDEYDWKGMVPFDELPFSYNPENGYVSSANNIPVGPEYPYHIGLWFSPPYRIDRIRELIDSKDKLTIEDFEEIQTDEKSMMAELFMPGILKSLEGFHDLNPLQEQSLSLLSNWDYRMNVESPAATVFEMTYHKLLKNIFKDELGNTLFDRFLSVNDVGRIALHRIWVTGHSVWTDNIATTETETLSDITVESFKDAVDELQKDFGSNTGDWKWGDIHQLKLMHPLSKNAVVDKVFNLSRGPFRIGGSFHTIPQFNYPNTEFGRVNHGVSHRHIFTAVNWDKSLTVIPTGNSGIPAGKNYCDQTELYITNKYHNDPFSREVVEKGAESHMIFKKGGDIPADKQKETW